MRSELRKGDLVHGMIVEAIDLKRRSFRLFIEDPELDAPSLVLSPQPTLAARKRGAAVHVEEDYVPDERAADDDNSKEDGMKSAIAELMPGDIADGLVLAINQQGVLVNIGLERAGMLIVSAALKNQFKRGDRVQGMVVTKVDVQAEQVVLQLDDPMLETPAGPLRREGRRETRRSERPRGKSKAKVAE
mmetsp:Transcript_44953/g.143336  ORF Transcript_44953/g.143336 Transcript_44953/m.143336 type:complete len:189 (+) Transcript_44953:2444-3010(+)